LFIYCTIYRVISSLTGNMLLARQGLFSTCLDLYGLADWGFCFGYFLGFYFFYAANAFCYLLSCTSSSLSLPLSPCLYTLSNRFTDEVADSTASFLPFLLAVPLLSFLALLGLCCCWSAYCWCCCYPMTPSMSAYITSRRPRAAS
jgi:hypothetical protein